MLIKIIFISTIAFFSTIASADEMTDGWRWYYSSYYSPKTDTKILVRNGVANVIINDNIVEIEFIENGFEDSKYKFVGKIKNGNITGKLINFFPSADEVMQGNYRKKEIPNCEFRQIIIYPEYPDGSTLMVSKIDGACQ